MHNKNQQLIVVQIKKVNKKFILQFNNVLDIGIIWDKKVIWDIKQGKKFIANSDNSLFVAYLEKNIVGFLSAHKLARFDNKKAEVLIYDVGVHKDFRQLGIGKSLIKEVKSWAKSKGANEAWVITNKSNSQAVALYNSTGGEEDDPDLTMFVFKI